MRRRGVPLLRARGRDHRCSCRDGGRCLHHHQEQKYAGKKRLCSNSKIRPISRAWLTRKLATAGGRRTPQYAPAPAAAAPDLTAQLQQLAQLHTAGVLSDEEFAAAKQKLLGGLTPQHPICSAGQSTQSCHAFNTL